MHEDLHVKRSIGVAVARLELLGRAHAHGVDVPSMDFPSIGRPAYSPVQDENMDLN